MILFLNKTDILKEKIKTSSIKRTFPEFQGNVRCCCGGGGGGRGRGCGFAWLVELGVVCDVCDVCVCLMCV